MTTPGAEAPENAATPAPRAAIAAGIGVLVLLRIPALLEPRWYTDESIYAYVGRTVVGGGDLYTSPGAWDNKPPLQYWIYGILNHFLGYSEAAIHLVPFASAVATVIAVGWGVARLSGSHRRAGIACILAALVIGSPLFDAQLFLPEGALIGPMTWAGMLMLVQCSSPWWAARHRWAPYVAGALASIALGMQQTVIADVLAIGLIVLIVRPGAWYDLVRFYGTGLAVTLLWLLPTVVASGLGATWFATVSFYGIYAQNALPTSIVDGVLHFGALAGGGIAIIAGAVLVGRSTRHMFWTLWVLAAIDLLVAGSAHFPYPHLLVPSLPWVCAALAATPWHRCRVLIEPARRRRWLGSAALAAGVLLATVQGSYAGSYWINGRSLSSYYTGGYASLVSASERTWWQQGFAHDVAADQAVTAWLVAHGYANASAVVWNVADAWVYLTAPLTTVLPTVGLFNDDVLVGSRAAVGPYVSRHRPTVIITNQPSLILRPSILPVLARYYVAVFRTGLDTIYIERTALGL
jgi:hypothetical protein